MNLERTRIHCPTCGTFHPADYVEVDGVAFWRVHCPHGDHDGLLSDLYRMPPGSRMRFPHILKARSGSRQGKEGT